MNRYELLKQWRESDKLKDKIKLARNGNESDISNLIKDPRWSQCKEIKKAAIIFYNAILEKLINDPDVTVRETACEKVREKDLENLKKLQKDGKIGSWVDLEKIADWLPSLRDENNDDEYKEELAEYGRDCDLDKLVKDPEWEVRHAVAMRGRGKDLDILVRDKDDNVRIAVALQGRNCDLDILVHDKNEWVREAVARQGRGKDLDILVNDPDFIVRRSVAEKGREQDLDILVRDKDEYVREEVAKRGRDKDLDILVNDPDPIVRKAVASVGRKQDLDILARDENKWVREAAAFLANNINKKEN